MPSIRDFSGGVVNQELQNRDDGAGVLFDCKNVISSWNGELRKRTGTKILKSNISKKRIVPYRLPNGDDIIVLIDKTWIEGYTLKNEGELIKYMYPSSSTPVSFPSSGWESNTNGNWTVSANCDGDAYKAMFLLDGVSFPALALNSAYYQFYNSNETVVLKKAHVFWTCVSSGSESYIFGTDPVIQYSDDGLNWNSVQTTVSDYVESHLNAYTFVDYNVNISAAVGAHRYWRIRFTSHKQSGNITNVSSYMSFGPDSFNFASESYNAFTFYNNLYSEEDIDNIRWAQNGSTLTFACKGKQPSQIFFDVNLNQYNFRPFLPADEQGIWSSNGYPSSVCYYQNRLWFGGFDLYPTRVWSSAFGDFTHFSIPSPIAATSPIKIDGTEISGVIENMFGGNNALYCLSADGVSMIDAQNAIVATNQIEFKLRNREPASDMIPTVKDDIMIYLGRDKRKILTTDYDFVVQRFKAHCISNKYLDFFKPGIKELHYIPRFPSLIYGLLENGKHFALLFDLDNQKNSLYPFDLSGTIYDMQPVKIGDEIKLLMVVMLENGRWLIEEKNPRAEQEIMDFMSKSEKEEYTKNVINSNISYLDHSIIRSYESPVTSVSDLPYTIGNYVDVITNGTISRKEVKEHSSTTLYGWTSVANGTIYTESRNPTTASIVYNKEYSTNVGYEILSTTIVGGYVTALSVKCPYLASFLGYQKVDSIIVETDDEVQPELSGVFERYTAGDTTVTNTVGEVTEYVACCAWKQDEAIVYTKKADVIAPDMPCCTATSGTDLFNGDYSVASLNESTDLYMVLGGGANVYDIDNEVVGTASSYSASGMTISGVYCARDTSLDRQGVVYFTQAYSKSSNNVSFLPGYVELDEETNNVVIGYPYDSYAVLKFVSPYNMRKFPKEISVNFINSGYVELGNTFESLRPINGNLIDTVSINNKPILINGNYTMTFDKQTFETPYVIVRSDKPMPFIITGMDYKVDMSNYQGGV